MKTIFDTTTREEIVARINTLTMENKAEWGKMNVFQMVKHCTQCDEMFQGKIKINRVIAGRIFGKLVLKKVLKDDKHFGKNSPTSSRLIISEKSGDIESEKKEWIDRIAEYSGFSKADFIHPFFGRMTTEQIGYFAYKHADHHLRQFGA